jgi:hypothetical protein
MSYKKIWFIIIVWVLFFTAFTIIGIDMHEKIHVLNCEYQGGNATKTNMLVYGFTVCENTTANFSAKYDMLNEIIGYNYSLQNGFILVSALVISLAIILYGEKEENGEDENAIPSIATV